jgi:hypothetical protein
MKAKQSIAASFALAAIASALVGKRWKNAVRREKKNDEMAHQAALDTFESEGGLVLA